VFVFVIGLIVAIVGAIFIITTLGGSIAMVSCIGLSEEGQHACNSAKSSASLILTIIPITMITTVIAIFAQFGLIMSDNDSDSQSKPMHKLLVNSIRSLAMAGLIKVLVGVGIARRKSKPT
jgi:hypothetical protein